MQTKVSSMDNKSDLFESFETARLRLRCVRSDDATSISRMMTPAVSRWLAAWPVPFTTEMAIERIANARQAFMEGRALPCVIERRSDGVLLGWVGVTRREAGARRGMLGYWMGEAHHGQGYMREVAPAVMKTAFDNLDLDVIEAAAQPENEASLAVLRGCGMVASGERMIFASARSRDELCLLYETARPAG